MFGLGRKKKQKKARTFKEGVAAFWQWYPTVAERFFQTIEEGNCGDLADETTEFMAANLPALSWVFGPGEQGGHSFTVSGEGIVAKQLLAHHWVNQAVEVPGWTFWGSRQASPIEELAGYAIRVGQQESVDTTSFLIHTDVDEEHEIIHITAWHPLYAELDDSHHAQILFLLLDEALGEFGTQNWIGRIEIAPLKNGDQHVRPLTELPDYIRSVGKYHEWEKLPPPDTYSVYQLNEQSDAPRGDTIAGTSILPRVFCDFIADGGKLEDNPLDGTGASLAYISFATDSLPDGQQSEVRGQMEDAIDAELEENLSGRVLGGALGIERSYIDLLMYDGERTVSMVRKLMQELQIPAAELHLMD